jgi:hypothetical protein
MNNSVIAFLVSITIVALIAYGDTIYYWVKKRLGFKVKSPPLVVTCQGDDSFLEWLEETRRNVEQISGKPATTEDVFRNAINLYGDLVDAQKEGSGPYIWSVNGERILIFQDPSVE